MAWIVGRFFLMEQFLAWHHTHSMPVAVKQPVTYLILLADRLHNFIGGLAIGTSFLVSTEVGIITWIAAAALVPPVTDGTSLTTGPCRATR